MTDITIAAPLAAALSAKGYDSLTPVQSAMLAADVAGKDVLVSAQTGSGKTVAFGIGIAEELLRGADRLLYADVPMALCIAPTRELALQVARELEWLYAEAGAKIATCVGGMDYRTEKRALERGAHIVVGTPGRLRDHIERRSLDLSGLKAVVLDEADEMLDLGFRDDLEFILQAAPEERRTLMFSATVSKEIAGLAKDFQRDALRIQTQGEAKQHVDIEYRALSVAARDREHAIFNVLRFYESRTAIVFCKTRANVNHLMARMGNRGFQVVALSGELSQQERTHALQALRDGRARVCIATDVAARGIDLPGLELVIHADLPSNSETLLHRSGRTGRAGNKGVSALIVAPADFKKAQRLLQGAKVVAEWGKAPSADDVQAKDDVRLLEHPALQADVGDEAATADTLIQRFGAERVAAAFIRLWREGRSAPEELSDTAAPVVSAPKERGEFGPSVWFALSVGRSGRAEARWLLPKICDAGGITKDGIGAIRVQEDRTFVQIAEGLAARFGATMEIETGVTMERLPGEPMLERAERAPRPAAGKPERRVTPRPAREERTERPQREERAERPAYVPKPSRFVEDDEAVAERKPYAPRAEKPAYAPRVDKPAYAPRGDKPAYAPRGDKPAYAPRGDKPAYAPRGDKPAYAPRAADAGAKPYAPKPYAPRGDAPDADRKPRWKADGGAPKSAGYKSHGASPDRPARAAGFKSHATDGAARPKADYKPRSEGDAPRPYKGKAEGGRTEGFKPRGEGAKPFKPREGAEAKPFRAKPAGGKPAFGKAKPAAPRANASDTSKRFVPPKRTK